VFIKLSTDNGTINTLNTPSNSRNLSANFSPTFFDQVESKTFESPIRKIVPNRKPPLSPNIPQKFQSPQKTHQKSTKYRQLSVSFILSKAKFQQKVQNEQLKLRPSV
jgi:hypothetical protein